jgi:hypothetical protein
MNPLSDGFVDAEAIAEHRVRLVVAAADRAYLFAPEDATRRPAAPRRWSRRIRQLVRLVRFIPTRGTPAALVGSSGGPPARH